MLEDILTRLLKALSRIPAMREAVRNTAYEQQPLEVKKRDSALDTELSFLPKPALRQWHAMSEFYDRESLVKEMKEASRAFAELWNYAPGTHEYWALEREVATKYVRKAYLLLKSTKGKSAALLPTPRFNYGELMTK
ncbi:hypothetical protein HY642_02575 [Candidatus Woesearchaeota archaeon]|nr:hypothetical protein [Candidatus Woesearchaeota archaeon]